MLHINPKRSIVREQAQTLAFNFGVAKDATPSKVDVFLNVFRKKTHEKFACINFYSYL
jgi:hypothetical protein